jgi:hypothetical protein
MKQHHEEGLEHKKLLALEPHNVSEYNIYFKNHYPITDQKTFMLNLCQQSISKDSICPVNTYYCIFERKTCQNVTRQVKAAKEGSVWFE